VKKDDNTFVQEWQYISKHISSRTINGNTRNGSIGDGNTMNGGWMVICEQGWE
jgi:hypothetical protein